MINEYDMVNIDPLQAEFNPAGSGEAEMDDYSGIAALSSLPTQIQTQADWDRLPPWAKQIARAQAQGVQLSVADVNRFVVNAMAEERRMQQQPTVVEIEEPGTGRKVPYIQTSTGNLQPLRQEAASRTERFVAEDGRVMLLDKETGLAKAVTDDAGNPIRAQERAQGFAASFMDQIGNPASQQAKATLARRLVELQAIEARIAKDGADAQAGFLRGTLQDQHNKLRAEIAQLEVQAGGSMPPRPAESAPPQNMPQEETMPQPAPPPNPMPTPQPATSTLTARNPQTGEVVIWNGSQWVPQ